MRIHPDLTKLKDARLDEARAGLEASKILLNSGLLKASAFEIVKAWRAYLSFMAIENRDLVKARIRGFSNVNGYIKVPRVDLLIASMPINMMIAVANILSQVDPGLVEVSAMVPLARNYYCSGKCSSCRGTIPDDSSVKVILVKLITELERRLQGV